MKFKKILLAFSGLALAFGTVVGLNIKGEVKEAKADDPIVTYYLTGTFNGFSTNLENCVLFEAHTASEVKLLGYSFTGANEFKAIYAEDGVYKGWAGDIYGTGSGDNQINSRSGINVYNSGTNAGIHFNKDSSTNAFNIYFNHTNAHFYVDYAYKLTVGSTDYWMERNGDGEEYAKTITATTGDSVSVTSFNGSTETVNPQSKASNNLTTGKKVKLSGSTTISWQSLDKSAWASGYAPASSELQNFCDALLALDCSATDLTSCGWSGLDASDKADFNDEIVHMGYDIPYNTYGSVVNEAATRYVLLIAKGATPLAGVTLASAINVVSPLSEQSNTNSTLVIAIVISSIALFALAGYFFLRKKHQ